MHPALIAAMATFGVQKIRGKSTSRALRDAVMAAGFTYGVGEIGEGIKALGSNTAAASTATNLAAQGGTTAEALNIAKGIGADSALFQMEAMGNPVASSILGGGSNFGAGYAGSKVAAYDTAMSQMQPLTGLTKDVKEGYESIMKKYEALDPITKFAVKYGTVPVATALLTPDELPKGMSYEEFMKLDSETRARLLAEAREGVKGLGDKAQPLYTQSDPYNYQRGNPLYTPFNQGGIVSVLPRYAQGGINYLPSKVTHDENDVHNYVRATGYVEDGSGNGDKDEDTILAQLADGEFVSRADAILGAGIMAGASPSNFKDMRSKGASFFYEQQARFKRIFDLLDASRKVTTN
jgi:hypothetical protein